MPNWADRNTEAHSAASILTVFDTRKRFTMRTCWPKFQHERRAEAGSEHRQGKLTWKIIIEIAILVHWQK